MVVTSEPMKWPRVRTPCKVALDLSLQPRTIMTMAFAVAPIALCEKRWRGRTRFPATIRSFLLTALTGIITLTMGELVVTDSLTITGIPIGTISGNSSSRIFSFTGGSSFLIGLTIRDGRKQVLIGNPTNGGGIYNSATLHLYGCSLINNHVLGTDTLSPSSASGGAGQGGGIYNSGTLFLDGIGFCPDQ